MEKLTYFKTVIDPSLVTLASQLASGDTFEKAWISSRLADPELATVINQLSIVNMHTLKAIAVHHSINGVALSEKLGVTRGTISKSTKKLLQLDLIQQEKHPDNQKEIHYRLTAAGKAINEQHQALDQYLDAQSQQVIGQFSETELQTVAAFLDKMSQIRKQH